VRGTDGSGTSRQPIVKGVGGGMRCVEVGADLSLLRAIVSGRVIWGWEAVRGTGGSGASSLPSLCGSARWAATAGSGGEGGGGGEVGVGVE
jgi:hypothetical protein